MGNHHAHGPTSVPEDTTDGSVRRHSSSKRHANNACLEKLFQKLELTADGDNVHPGELLRKTFEDVFHGPLQLFGKLLYRQMVVHGNSSHGNEKVKDRITCDQFVKAGKQLLKLFDETAQHKYYFQLFAIGKDHLTKEDAVTMVNVSYSLTLASSMIAYSKSAWDDKVFESMVQSMFNIEHTISYSSLERWLGQHCPHMFCGIHNWVYTILTGSKMPSELETAPVPQLDKFIDGHYCMTMGTLWALSATIPYSYTHSEKEGGSPAESTSGTKNPLLNSFQFLMKLARLPRCQSWSLLYNSEEHGLSMNRFNHHVSAYNGPTITIISFEGRNVYCIAEDQAWKEGETKFGSVDTVLLQVTPVYRVVQAKGPLVIWNQYSRAIPKGLHIGKDGRTSVLHVPADFDKVQHYGVDCELHKVEMWGCGGDVAKTAQNKQKNWERKEVHKHSSRKLHMDVNWDENPDKQLLSWGGIQVNHQYSREGGN